MDIERFASWLNNELKNRNWTQAELSRKSGVSTGQIARLMTGERGLGEETVSRIARALSINPITVYRAAGFIPEVPDTIRFDDFAALLEQLTEDERDELRDYALMKIQRREREAALKNLSPKKARG